MWKRLLNQTKATTAAAAASDLVARRKPSSPSPTRRAAPGVSSDVLLRLKQAAASNDPSLPPDEEDASLDFSKEIMSILHGSDDADESAPPEGKSEAGEAGNKILGMKWFSPPSQSMAQWRKEVSREKKKRYIFKNTESRRFTRLMRMSAERLGTDSTLEFFGKLGRETGLKEFNALIKLSIDGARSCKHDDMLVDQIHRAHRLFVLMRERGFLIDEQSYGPFLLYLVDMRMTEEFKLFSRFFKDANPKSHSRIAYYEMLLWIGVEDEEKIQELCRTAEDSGVENQHKLLESYILAFAESDRKMDLISLLEVLDLTKVSNSQYISRIFKSLGRFKLENYMEKFLQEMCSKESTVGNISSLIIDYAANIPNIVVEDIILAFNTWHEKYKVTPSLGAYDKIISLCCNSSEVSLALDVADCMCQSNPNVPIESFHPIIHACEQGCELEMVHPIYDLIRRHKLKPKSETFKSMINLCIKMKDFEGAYNILADAEDVGEISTVILYNTIMVGYFRGKNIKGALMVRMRMQNAGVKPDSETFSFLIVNCESEEYISKYLVELRQAGVEMTKHVYMALIYAYSRLGNFDMAKQVLLDCEIPPKHLNEIKSALVAALASNGQLSDGLQLYEEMKQSGCCLEPRAVISLIEHIQTEGELDRLYQLLEELGDSSSWFDGCSRVILYCVQYNQAEAAIGLLKQLKEKDEMITYMVVDQVFCQLWNMEPVNLDVGMELLHAVKEELGLNVSRTSLDFLLSACAKAKDPRYVQQIWAQYQSAGLPYNVLSSLRMYQALLSSGDRQAARKMLGTIPKEDPHVRYVIRSCKMTYSMLL